MPLYELARVPRITGGAGARHGVGKLAAALVPAEDLVLLVADPGLAGTGLIEELDAAIGKAGLGVVRFTAFTGDPTIAHADAGAEVAREEGASLVVALGGGSALDLAKAVAAIANDGRSAATFALGATPVPADPLPVIAVPTTAGTGSELTRTAVLSRADKAKVWLWGETLRASEVVLDPEATLTLPRQLTAWTGIDALIHAIEAATNRNATPANDTYALRAVTLAATHLPRAVEDGRDILAREGLQRAAALAGIAIDNAGTAIAHNIGHALASLRPVHHGRAVAAGLLATFPWSCAEDPDGRFAAVAQAMGVPGGAAALPAAFARLCGDIGIGPALDGFEDITAEALATQMAAPENAPMRRSTRRKVADADLLVFAGTVLGRG